LSAAPAPRPTPTSFRASSNGVLGTKMKVCHRAIRAATRSALPWERGEVQGRCGWSWSSVKTTHQKWLDEKKIHGPGPACTREASRPVGCARWWSTSPKTDEQRQLLRLVFARQVMGRPFYIAPARACRRTASMRCAVAFMATMTE